MAITAAQKSDDPLALDCRRGRAQVPDGRQLARLRVRRERPCDRGATERRDERAPVHSPSSLTIASGLLSRKCSALAHVGGFAAEQEVVARRREEIDHFTVFAEPSLVLRTSRNNHNVT